MNMCTNVFMLHVFIHLSREHIISMPVVVYHELLLASGYERFCHNVDTRKIHPITPIVEQPSAAAVIEHLIEL